MTSTRKTAARLIALTALLAATGWIAAPLAIATAATSPASVERSRAATASTSEAVVPKSAAAPADFASIYSGPNANLADSGWSSCPTPIAWTVDTRELTPAQAAEQVANLDWAFSTWSQASGLTFRYAGELDLTYDDSAFTVSPLDGSAVQERHIYLDFLAPSQSSRLSGDVVGLGSPSQVTAASKQIVDGEAIFRTDHARTASPDAVKSLYLHELGHVLGLAHAASASNVMFPVVSDNVTLGAGDINGVRAMTKPCAA